MIRGSREGQRQERTARSLAAPPRTTGRWLRRTVRLAVLGVLATFTSTSPAAAKPQVALSFASGGADAGQPFTYGFAASGVPGRARIVLQRQMGTAKSYGTVATLAHAPSGTGTLPALPLGSYRLRIAVFVKKRINGKRRTVITAQQSQLLRVYGSVPLSTLAAGTSYNDEGTYTTPIGTFPYALRVYTDAALVTAFTASKNRCRSIHLDFVPESGSIVGNKTTTTTHVSVVQESLDPVSGSTPSDQVASLDARLVPGKTWSITVANDPGAYHEVYLNGSASCFGSDVTD